MVAKIWSLNEEIGIPVTTDAIREEDIGALVDAALSEGCAYPVPRFLERAECESLIRDLRTP